MNPIAAAGLALSAVAVGVLCYLLMHCYQRRDTLRDLRIPVGSRRLWIPWWGWGAIFLSTFVLGLGGMTAVSRTETAHLAGGTGPTPLEARSVSATVRLPFYVRTTREVQGVGGVPIQRTTTTSVQIPWIFLLAVATYWLVVTIGAPLARTPT